MASMLGHVLGGGAALGLASRIGPAALAGKRALWLSAFVAVAPDLDNPLAILLGRHDWLAHRGPSHSLLVIGVIAALAAAAAIWGRLRADEGPAWAWARAFLVFGAVGASHLVLDWLMGRGSLLNSPASMEVLWPFSDRTIANSPVQLIPTAYYSARSWEAYFGVLAHWKTWVGLLLELVILVPPLLLAWGKAPRNIRWPLAGLSAAGMLVTFILYQLADKL